MRKILMEYPNNCIIMMTNLKTIQSFVIIINSIILENKNSLTDDKNHYKNKHEGVVNKRLINKFVQFIIKIKISIANVGHKTKHASPFFFVCTI